MQVLNKMRSFGLISILLLSVTSFSVALPRHAAAVNVFNVCTDSAKTADETANCRDCTNSVAATSTYCKSASSGTSSNPVIHIITIAIDIVSYIGGAAAVIALIVSGLRMVLANGNPDGVKSARTGIIYSLIGLVVIVMAQSIVIFVLNRIK